MFFVSTSTNVVSDFLVYLGFYVILGITLLWAAVDVRPAIAAGLCFQATYLAGIFLTPGTTGIPDTGQTLILALITAALAAAALRARRKATT